MRRDVRAKLVASMLIVFASSILGAAAQTTQDSPGGPPLVSTVEAPPGTDTLKVEWIKVAAPGSGAMLAAVARPPGNGPFPTIILMHGTHGFAQEYVRLARDLADGGVIAVAACWFRGSGGGAPGL